MRLRLTAVIVVAAVSAALVGCARPGTIAVAGRVADDVATIQAPALAVQLPSIDAGFEMRGTALPPSFSADRSTAPTITAVTGIGSFSRVETVAVSVGETVTAGRLIAAFEAGALDANIEVARANHSVASAQVPVLNAAIVRTRDADEEIASTRSTVSSAIRTLTGTRPQLVKQLAQLKALLKQIENSPKLPPGVTPPPGTPVPPDPAVIRQGIAQLEAGIQKLDAGLVTARSGLRKLADASADLADARVQLRHLRTLARVSADAAAVGVNVATYQRSSAVVVAPFDGVVVQVVQAGDVLAPGATVAVIRRRGDPVAETWLAAEDLSRIAIGDTVTVSADWFGGSESATGTISRIGHRAEVPPTSFATKDVHLTRAVQVEVAVTPRAGLPTLPPGTPLDLTISPGSRPDAP